jgi:hypothetical protein
VTCRFGSEAANFAQNEVASSFGISNQVTGGYAADNQLARGVHGLAPDLAEGCFLY